MKKTKLFWFHITWILFFIPSAVYLFIYDKGDFSLLVNKEHNQTADIFFRYSTYLGGTGAMICFTIILLFVRYCYSLVFLLNSATVFLIITALKILFAAERPVLYFSRNAHLHYVPGVTILTSYSFPSGHSANAFCMYFTLAFFIQNQFAKFFLCIVALLVAFSRVYLLQHFLVDVFFGALVAVGATHVLMVFYTKKTKIFSNRKLAYSLLRNWK